MNVKKIILGSLLVLLLLSSCSVVGPMFGILPDSTMGVLLSVDSDGYFREEIQYDFGDWKIIYRTNGTFSEYQYDYSETAGEIIETGVYDGTYSWNKDTYVMQYYFDTYTDYVDDLVYEQDYTGELTKYFTNTNAGDAYLLTTDGGNTWERSRTYEYADGSIRTITYSYTITSTSISYEYLNEYRDSAGNIVSGSTAEIEYDIINIYPEGTEWKSGQSVTFTVDETLDRYADITSEGTGAWTDYSLERTRLNMGNAGDFMFFNSASTDKSLTQDL